MIVGEIAFDELTNVAVEAYEKRLKRMAEKDEYQALLCALAAVFTAIASHDEGTHEPTIGSKQ